MKRRASSYASLPAVPGKVVAGTNPVGSVALGGQTPRIVPPGGGASHGFGPQEHQFGTPHVKGSHGYGHPPKARKGHERLSGNPLAHRVGKK